MNVQAETLDEIKKIEQLVLLITRMQTLKTTLEAAKKDKRLANKAAKEAQEFFEGPQYRHISEYESYKDYSKAHVQNLHKLFDSTAIRRQDTRTIKNIKLQIESIERILQEELDKLQ